MLSSSFRIGEQQFGTAAQADEHNLPKQLALMLLLLIGQSHVMITRKVDGSNPGAGKNLTFHRVSLITKFFIDILKS